MVSTICYLHGVAALARWDLLPAGVQHRLAPPPGHRGARPAWVVGLYQSCVCVIFLTIDLCPQVSHFSCFSYFSSFPAKTDNLPSDSKRGQQNSTKFHNIRAPHVGKYSDFRKKGLCLNKFLGVKALICYQHGEGPWSVHLGMLLKLLWNSADTSALADRRSPGPPLITLLLQTCKSWLTMLGMERRKYYKQQKQEQRGDEPWTL